MPAYRVALASRGGGAFTYTYLGPEGLERGQLCGVRFRSRIEIGVVIGLDNAPPKDVALQPLCPVSCPIAPGWGRLLLDTCALACAAPHEVVPRMSPTGAGSGLRLQLTLQKSARLHDLAPNLLSLAGSLPPQKRRILADEALWNQCCCASEDDQIGLELVFTGQPGVTSAAPGLARWYRLGDIEVASHSIGAQASVVLPGAYIAGLAGKVRLTSLKRIKDAPAPGPLPSAKSAFKWEGLAWPADWDICRRWPGLMELAVRRCQCSWPELKNAAGLLAELTAAVAQDQRVLLLAPQVWMLDRLWPALVNLAPWLVRHRSDDPPSTVSHLLYRLQAAHQAGAPLVIAGTEAAWRLTAYGGCFNCAILIDPSHPQWAVETTPSVDPRTALLLGLVGCGSAELRVVELGLSAFDGRAQTPLTVDAPFEELPTGDPETAAQPDMNPLPLHLRQPGIRRLVYFNRLGASRGLVCAECQSGVGCPQCRSRSIHYSRVTRRYSCPDCGFAETELRCPRCGLAALMAHLPGLEALRVRPGEHIVSGGSYRPVPEHHTVLGTAQLLEPISSFWPQHLVYVDPDERDLPDSDGRAAIDMAQRLAALYANAELASVHIVSARLADRTADSLDAAAIAAYSRQEDGLRRLGGLPPYGCLYRFRVLAAAMPPLEEVRTLLGTSLSQHAGTALLRLGKPFMRLRRAELHGWLLNPAITWSEWQELRWATLSLRASLGINPRRGPWL